MKPKWPDGRLNLEGWQDVAQALLAHTRHRVTFTSRPAVWLGVFY